MSNTYYYIPSINKRKYKSLEAAQEVCKKHKTSKFTIIKCTEEEIEYDNSKNQISNSPEVVKIYMDKIKDVLCNPSYDFENDSINNFDSFIDYDFKQLNCNKSFNELFKEFILQLFEKYPVDKIDVGKLITNYKPCNGIYFQFVDLYDYNIKSGIKYKFHDNLFNETSEYDIYPVCFSIMFRADTTSPNVVFDTIADVFGRNVKSVRKEPVDLTSNNVQKYIDTALDYISKSKIQ